MITKRHLDNELNLLIQRQNLMMDLLTSSLCSNKQREKIVESWNELWFINMEDIHGKRS